MTLRQRPGDQPLPVPNDRPDIQSMVIEDVKARREVGIERYGTPLQPFNTRDALLDAYEESLDQTMYLKQEIVQRGSTRDQLVTVVMEHLVSASRSGEMHVGESNRRNIAEGIVDALQLTVRPTEAVA